MYFCTSKASKPSTSGIIADYNTRCTMHISMEIEVEAPEVSLDEQLILPCVTPSKHQQP